VIHDSAVNTYINPSLAPWTLTTVFTSSVAALQAAINGLEVSKVSKSTANLPNGYAAINQFGFINGLLIPYGTTAGTACEGNDSRLSDARTPTAHATTHQDGGSDEVATEDAAAGAIPKANQRGELDDDWIPDERLAQLENRFRLLNLTLLEELGMDLPDPLQIDLEQLEENYGPYN
jgi:hypothetical protein